MGEWMLKGVRKGRKFYSSMDTLVLLLSVAIVTEADFTIRLKCLCYEMTFNVNL